MNFKTAALMALVVSIIGLTGAGVVAAADGTAEVTVVDNSTGDAISGATVEITDPSDGSLVASGETDSNGTFTASVPEGDYDVVALAPGYETATNVGFNVTAGTVNTLEMQAVEATTGAIKIDVSDPNGTALNGATVELLNMDRNVVNSGDTATVNGNDGEIVFNNIEEGDYRIDVSSSYGNYTGTTTVVGGAQNTYSVSLAERAKFVGAVQADSADAVTAVYAALSGVDTNTSVDVSVSTNGTDLGTETFGISTGQNLESSVGVDYAENEKYRVEVLYNDADATVDGVGVLYETMGGGGGGGTTDGTTSDSTPGFGVIAALAALAGAILLAGRQSEY